MEISFKEFDELFLELSWHWLNDPEIKILTATPEFTKEQQKIWFNSLPFIKDYVIWGVEADSVPIGACGLKNFTEVDCEYWGYIGEKYYWGIGIGKEIMDWTEKKAMEYGKSSIWLKVIKNNTKAISLYRKQRYTFESETDTLIVMRKKL